MHFSPRTAPSKKPWLHTKTMNSYRPVERPYIYLTSIKRLNCRPVRPSRPVPSRVCVYRKYGAVLHVRTKIFSVRRNSIINSTWKKNSARQKSILGYCIVLYDTAAQPTKVTRHVSYYRLIINWCSTSSCGGFDIHQIRLPREAKQFYSTQICKSINVQMLHKK